MKDTKKIKRLILISLVVLIAIIIIIAISLKIKDKVEHNESEEGDGEPGFVEEVGMNDVIFRKNYFAVSDMINGYNNYLNLKNDLYYGTDANGNHVQTSDEDDIKNIIYSELSEEYIRKNSIIKNSVFNFIKTTNEAVNFTPVDMKVYTGNKVDKYLVYGILSKSSDNTFVKKAYYYVNVDNENMTFSIEPLDVTDVDMEKVKFDNNEASIKANDYNTFEYEEISDERVCREYLNMYRRLGVADASTYYNYIIDSYKKGRFNTLDSFKQYVANNKDMIYDITLRNYRVDVYDDYTQYICIDQNGNYYIFNETKVGKYTGYLDNYSVDIDQFIEKYDSSTSKNQVAMNAEKVKMAINNMDYEYVYSKLDSTYKQNNFPTIDVFKKYINDNFFRANTFAYTTITTQNDTYIANINVNDYTGKDLSTKRISILMKFVNNRDFIMSFGLNQD